MIEVVGGCYRERCVFPNWAQLYGSGARAAALIPSLGGAARLHSFADDRAKADLSCLAKNYNFSCKVHESLITPEFFYLHALSTPVVNSVPSCPKIDVEGEVILRFGMLEAETVVHGKKVIYDPQSGSPEHFFENGSTAERLALVLNLKEIQALTGEDDPYEAIKMLSHDKRVEVVIVKMGPDGGVIYSNGEVLTIPCIKTPRVFPIGSGDVFSATFAYYWGEKDVSSYEAALLATKATACYCASSSLILPPNFQDTISEEQECRPKLNSQVRQVYLAGPFFNIAERWLIEELRQILLGFGFKVFSPVHEIGPGKANDVAPKDIEGLQNCDVIFAVVNGLDSGTIFEIGYGRALDKPVFVLAQNEKEEDLKMIAGTKCMVSSELATLIYQLAWSER